MKKLALLAILLSTTAYAQENAEAKPKQAQATPVPTPSPTPAATPAPSHVMLDFDQADLNTLNVCIGELPYKIANPFVQKLNVQINKGK